MNATSTSRMVSRFEAVAPELERTAGGPVHLLRIIGPRSSFVAGRVPENMPFVEPVRVALNDEWTVIFYPAPGCCIDREAVKALFNSVDVD